MRQLTGFWMVLLLSTLAAGQADLIPPGTYAQPFIPRIVTPLVSPESVITPSLSLGSPSPEVGATNATAGNVAGAGNTTSSVVTLGQPVHYNQPLWYAPGSLVNQAVEASVSPAPAAARRHESHGFEFGAATFQSSYGVARLMAEKARRKASRAYLNPDVARVNDNNGMVKYRGKAAQIN
jgi:hypothetical protein